MSVGSCSRVFNETAFTEAFVFQRDISLLFSHGFLPLYAQPWDLRPSRNWAHQKVLAHLGLQEWRCSFSLLYALQNEKEGRENAKTWERGGISSRGPGKPMGSSAARGSTRSRAEPHNVGSREQGVRRVPHTRPGRGKGCCEDRDGA